MPVETIYLEKTPLLQQSFIQLFQLFDVPLESNQITQTPLRQLVLRAQDVVLGATNPLQPLHLSNSHLPKALVITDLGIIRHQIRLMFQRIGVEAVDTGLNGEVAKLLETSIYSYVVLELPYLMTAKDSEAVYLPTVLNYLVDFKRNAELDLNIIVIINRKDPRVSNVEKLASHLIIKEPGWQIQLQQLLRK